MNNIAIIPARSGSKGLKDKNIKEIKGIPLIGYSIICAKKSGCFSEIMVSTDSEEYKCIAEKYGAMVPFMRSSQNSSDTAGSWDVVKEVLKLYKEKGWKFDTICLLQPTSPLREPQNVQEAYQMYYDMHAEAITSVCESEHSPLWTMTLPVNNSLQCFRERLSCILPRQSLEKYYRLNGAIYIRKIKYIKDKIIICDKDEYAYEMARKNSVDIDTIEDLNYAEYLMSIKEEN